MDNVKNLILIGSSARNSGKTTLALRLIKEFKNQYKISVLKITSISSKDAACPHPASGGCGACSIKQDYVLQKESEAQSKKDTSLILASGIQKDFWLRTLYTSIKKGFDEFLSLNKDSDIIICESNILREYIKPAVFIMLVDSNSQIKNTAQKVMRYADLKINAPFQESDFTKILSKINLELGAS